MFYFVFLTAFFQSEFWFLRGFKILNDDFCNLEIQFSLNINLILEALQQSHSHASLSQTEIDFNLGHSLARFIDREKVLLISVVVFAPNL